MSAPIPARSNQQIIEQMYQLWQTSPDAVDANWRAFFQGFQLGLEQEEAQLAAGSSTSAAAPVAGGDGLMSVVDARSSAFRHNIVTLIEEYRTNGHFAAWLDPLAETAPHYAKLDLENFGLSSQDLSREITTNFYRDGKKATLQEMIADLRQHYCGHLGIEYSHISDPETREWIRSEVENRFSNYQYDKDCKSKMLHWLMEAELFEEFLGKKFIGEKRFSLEGGEGLMVLLNTILEQSPANNVQAIEMGMAHRGRLNVLANFLRKSLRTILYEFTPNYLPEVAEGDGDVKYHLGYSNVRQVSGGQVRVELAANPSHLEAVNAVVEGRARARQRMYGDDIQNNRNLVLPVLIHGDAAFAGQGSVAEVLNLSQLKGYRTGGTIHLIVNNQIGFTTLPEDARSSDYATDVAKMIQSPIIHVNGEEPTELMWAADFALRFRQRYNRDIVIDMYCYRRQGHNENDQAAFTNPVGTRKIERRKTVADAYRDRLISEGVIDSHQGQQMEKSIWDAMEADYVSMVELEEKGDRTAFSGSTGEIQAAYSHASVDTGVDIDTLNHIGRVLTEMPRDIELHPILAKRFLPRRAEALAHGKNIDWAFAESLAFGSLLLENIPVRLSGQDVRRGTFSHRHVVLHDFNSGNRYTPLQHLSDNQARFTVYNSLLSEAAVLGFDYGYSLLMSNMLVLWEAQFGDFANGAQVIIDQFITSAETKWQTPSSIVMLLPHGYEGQGPEHSSGRVERFLQLCADDNIVVANLTTPAQYFHILRRQKKRAFRKPLVLMTPKSLLTKPEAVSQMDELTSGNSFKEVLDDARISDASAVERVVFCSGKVYYDLDKYRVDNGITNTAIIRIEQLYPLHCELLHSITSRYSNAQRFVWAQEEPANMGAWNFIRYQIDDLLGVRLALAGRKASPSPAEGAKALHYAALKKFLKEAFTI